MENHPHHLYGDNAPKRLHFSSSHPAGTHINPLPRTIKRPAQEPALLYSWISLASNSVQPIMAIDGSPRPVRCITGNYPVLLYLLGLSVLFSSAVSPCAFLSTESPCSLLSAGIVCLHLGHLQTHLSLDFMRYLACMTVKLSVLLNSSEKRRGRHIMFTN